LLTCPDIDAAYLDTESDEIASLAADVGTRFYRQDVDALIDDRHASLQGRVIPLAHHNSPGMDEGFFCTNLKQGLRRGYTVVLDAVQIAFYMGFTEVVISGCDLSYRGEQTHFYGTGAYERSRTNDMPVERVKKAFQIARS
jgi:hypothetical protein